MLKRTSGYIFIKHAFYYIVGIASNTLIQGCTKFFNVVRPRDAQMLNRMRSFRFLCVRDVGCIPRDITAYYIEKKPKTDISPRYGGGKKPKTENREKSENRPSLLKMV